MIFVPKYAMLCPRNKFVSDRLVPNHLDKMLDWVRRHTKADARLELIRSDASFRRYYRVYTQEQTWILADSPPEKESNAAFVALSKDFLNVGVLVPKIKAYEASEGFILMTDFGDTLYSDMLSNETADNLYKLAIDSLLRFQFSSGRLVYALPHYDEALLVSECALFKDWFLDQHLGIKLEGKAAEGLDESFCFLIEQALSQPSVLVHRDYHSRNLLYLQQDEPGIIDFQDAVLGPLTYDLVSLLKDCYVQWPQNKVHKWARQYFECLPESIKTFYDWQAFIRQFDWMGVQRHCKAVGIFARLYHRDGKAGYLKSIPLTLNYLQAVSNEYPQLDGLRSVLQHPAVASVMGRAVA